MNKTLILMERALSVLEGYDGWVIGTCEFTYSGTFGGEMPEDYETEILKRGSSLAIATVRCQNNFLKIMLVQPSGKIGAESRKTGNNSQPKLWDRDENMSLLSFSENQVETYLTQVSDYNSIHKGKKAIVPGLLMVNSILEQIISDPACPFHGKVHFYAPLPVGEEAGLSISHKEDGQINASLWAMDETELLKVKISLSRQINSRQI